MQYQQRIDGLRATHQVATRGATNPCIWPQAWLGRPSAGGRRTGGRPHAGFRQGRSGLSVRWRPAHRQLGSTTLRRSSAKIVPHGNQL